MSNYKQPSRKTVKFYESERELLKYAGEHALIYRLRKNLLDPAKNWMPDLKKVFKVYFDNNWGKLNDQYERKKQRCLRQIETVNEQCNCACVAPIAEPEKLIKQLLSPDYRRFWKKMINRLEKNDVIVSPQDIRREYYREKNTST